MDSDFEASSNVTRMQTERPSSTRRKSSILLQNQLLNDLPPRPKVDITFRNLGYDVYQCNLRLCQRVKKTIISGVNGQFNSGQLTAVMGPSGAGKSTLLNVVSGYRVSNVTGTILVNGEKINPSNFRKISTYIMQHDQLMPFLSVREYMSMSANLKLSNKYKSNQKERIVKGVCDILKLNDCMDTRASKLSGGESKRLAIALELVNNPSLIFLDEPTSGLDTSNCTTVVQLLKVLASHGRTIVCTIHQPPEHVFKLFDKVFVLAKGAKVIYCDKPDSLKYFLKRHGAKRQPGQNPADFILEIANGDYANTPIAPFIESTNIIINEEMSRTELHKTKNEALLQGLMSQGYAATYLMQFKELFVRGLKGAIRDKETLQLRFYCNILVGLLIGAVYYDIGRDGAKVLDNLGMLFFSLLFVNFGGMLPTILTFPLELNVFNREHLNYWYSLKVYYLATTLAYMPMQIVFPLLFTALVYFMSYQPFEGDRFFKLLVIMLLIGLVAESYGLIFGCSLAPKSAVYIGPTSCIPFVLFSGFLISIDHIPFYFEWMGYVSYFRFGFEGMVNAIYEERDPLECNAPPDKCNFANNQAIYTQFGLKSSYLVDALVLFLFFCVIRVSGMFVLWLKTSNGK